jgi:aspartate 1-decarboxylase
LWHYFYPPTASQQTGTNTYWRLFPDCYWHVLLTLANGIILTIMFVNVLKSKLHRVKVTQAELNYVGSITIDEDLMDAAGLFENEQVHIVNNNNGERLITYVIKGERGSGIICLNGAAARKAQVGDIVIIIAYAMMTPEEAKTYKPTVVFPDSSNQLVKV